MAAQNVVQVNINDKPLTIDGYESEEYLQKVATYINNKYKEFKKDEGFTHMATAMQDLFVQLNLSDDYFKAKKEIDLLQEDIENTEKEIYDLKHELIAAQMKMETMDKNLKNLQNELNESAKKIVRIETELEVQKKGK